MPLRNLSSILSSGDHTRCVYGFARVMWTCFV